jgi:hypothetical protein
MSGALGPNVFPIAFSQGAVAGGGETIDLGPILTNVRYILTDWIVTSNTTNLNDSAQLLVNGAVICQALSPQNPTTDPPIDCLDRHVGSIVVALGDGIQVKTSLSGTTTWYITGYQWAPITSEG